MFGNRTFEERKKALEENKCTCFPDNAEHNGCLNNCPHRKEVIKKIESDEKQDSEE